jgi:uncharacterized membrane protein YhaH (DUF805 family)
MNFIEAIQSGFRNYVNFSGRAPRSEFWYWTLFAALMSIAAGFIDLAAFPVSDFFRRFRTLSGLHCFYPAWRFRSDGCMISTAPAGGSCWSLRS